MRVTSIQGVWLQEHSVGHSLIKGEWGNNEEDIVDCGSWALTVGGGS